MGRGEEKTTGGLRGPGEDEKDGSFWAEPFVVQATFVYLVPKITLKLLNLPLTKKIKL